MFSRLSISTKLLLILLPLIVFAVGTSAYLSNKYQEEEMLKQAQTSAQTYGEIVRESLVNMMITRQQIDDAYLAQLNALREIHNLHIHFRTDSLHLRDVYQSEDRLIRLQQREASMPAMQAHERGVFTTGEPIWQQKGGMFKAIIPFKAVAKCRQCHDVPEGYVLGAAEMDISLDRISQSIQSNWKRSIWILFIFISIAIICSVIVYRIVVERKMKLLVEATKIIGSGNLEAEQLQLITSSDELGDLARAFDQMRIELHQAQNKAIHSERLSMIGQMASSIVHDFRSPMSTINLAVDSLQRGKDFSQEKTQEWYRMIRESVQRMVTMAQELLDFSCGNVNLERTEFSVPEFTHLLVRSVKVNLEQAHIKLKIDERYSGTAVFDPDRLQRALINIINNAQDAMASGGMLSISTGKENGSITISIADTGKGIPIEIKDTMFEAFVTAGKRKGTGLGLAITKRIIDQHGGTIDVHSEQGKGTTFVVKIPTFQK